MSRFAVFSRSTTVTVTVVLLVTVFLFAPRLWIIRESLAGRMESGRTGTYLMQCADPFRRDIEPAMEWRLLPPLVCHTLGLRGLTPLAVPVIGAIVLTTYVAILLLRRMNDGAYIFGGTLLFATTSALLVPLNWLGVNDAWVWLGLLAVAFGRNSWALPLACLLGPWVDERFIIGFRLAWVVRQLDRDEPWLNRSAWQAAWLLPYAIVRIGFSYADPSRLAVTKDFLTFVAKEAKQLAPRLLLGWWMALRAGWVAVAYVIGQLPNTRRTVPVAVALVTLLVSFVLAADLSRSAAIIVPLMLLGCFEAARRQPAHTPRVILTLAIANLIIPAAHIVHVRIDLINSLPVELYRLWRPF